MMMVVTTLIALLSSVSAVGVASPRGVLMDPSQLADTFLLHVSYEQGSRDHFMTSRSRIVTFRRLDETSVLMLEVGDEDFGHRPLAIVPIVGEFAGALLFDFNSAFNKVFLEEDRTGEDYYGRAERQEYAYFPLFRRELLELYGHEDTLVMKQRAIDRSHEPLVVHYYLRRYRPNPTFEPVEMRGLERFGFFQTYPRALGGQTVLYATKFDIGKTVTFALSSSIPAAYRDAVRDGVLYWNKAFGFPALEVTDAPEGVVAPSAEYNVIQWGTGAHASTSHIQTDPITGEILHAHTFIAPGPLDEDRGDYVRYLVAHEVGHALGLRHNFARGPMSTVMNYYSEEEAERIGREIIAAGRDALKYDSSVIRAVYLGDSLDVETLPAFCTDAQPGCSPFDTRRAIGAAETER